MRWPWLISTVVHTAAVTGLVVAGPFQTPPRPRYEPSYILSIDLQAEAPPLFSSDTVVVSPPLLVEEGPDLPPLVEMECDLPPDEEAIENLLPPAPAPADRPLIPDAPLAMLPDTQRIARKAPEQSAESSSPETLPVSERPEIAPPVPVAGNPPPSYPLAARRRGTEGTVVVRLSISRTGAVIGLEVVRSSGSALLDRAALEALERWRFKPACDGVSAAQSEVVVPVRFILRDSG